MPTPHRIALSCVVIAAATLSGGAATAAPLHVSGRFLQDAHGNTIQLRGMNVPVYKSGFANDLDGVAAAVALTQANAARFEWYSNPPAFTTQYTTANLDRAIQKYFGLGLIPVLDLHDLTFQPGHDAPTGPGSDGNDRVIFASTITAYWTRPDVLAVLLNHNDHIVINIANEWGSSFYSDATPTTTNFIATYTTAIAALRNAGITAPLMIDAPKGFEYQFLLDHGAALLAADPLHNTLLSAHAYWAATQYTDANLDGIVDAIVASGLPIVLGEASSNAYTNIPCDPIHYDRLLTRANANGIGYLFWAWYEDGQCGQLMNITVNQDGVTLPTTPGFGFDALYAAGYGINAASPATRRADFSPVATLSIAASPASLDFGGESTGTTSQPRTITVANTGTGTLTISGIAASSQFSQANNCSTLAAGATCTVTVTFSPGPQAGAIGSATLVAGSVAITSNAAPVIVSLAGFAEKTLITHYYESILRRSPDPGGNAFWQGEALRMQTDGANPNEAWYAMSVFFFNGSEYASLNRDNVGFVTDLYVTFFNRAPDGGGLQFWVDQLNAGLPREVVLAGFLFSPEFVSFTQGIFGNTAVRAEIDVVMDFYRGALARLPDDGGLNFWVLQFRSAQCKGAGAVYAQANSISGEFFSGPEYAGRNRSNAQFVGDLYNAFLRRGGDPGGVQFWINQVNTGGQTRDQVRQAFLNSPEFGGRVNALVQQGCLP